MADSHGHAVPSAAVSRSQSPTAQHKDVLSDADLAPFISSTFNGTDFASEILRDPQVSSDSKRAELEQLLSRLDSAIQQEVSSKQDVLLSHARQVQDSDKAMQRLKGSISSMATSTQALKREVTVPYETVQQQVSQLKNLHDVTESLRRVNHHIKQAAKLRAAMQFNTQMEAIDLAKAAKMIWEIDEGTQPASIAGIEVVDRDASFVQESRHHIESSVGSLLQSGLEALSQADVASALQVAFNLGKLRSTVRECSEARAERVAEALAAALDTQKLGTTAASQTQSGARTASGAASRSAVQAAMWAALEACMERMQAAAVQVWHLQRVLSRKRDPLTLTLFADAAQEPGDASLLDTFWERTAAACAEGFAAAARGSGAVRDALSHAFPRLQTLVEAGLAKCVRESEGHNTPPAVLPQHREAMLRALAPLQEAFLSGCFGRLQAAVGAAFPQGARAPGPRTAVQQCIGAIHEELKGAAKSASLCALTAVAVGRAIALLCQRASAVAAPASELRSLSGAASGAQSANIALCSQLHDVHHALLLLLPKLAPTAAEVLAEPLEHLQGTAVEAVLPLFRAASDETEAYLLEMHSADWSADTDAATNADSAVLDSSAYMRRLGAFLRRFRTDYLNVFVPAPTPSVASFAALLCQRLAARALAFFVRHAALLRPLGQQGRLQLAKDAAELEQLLRQHITPPDLLRGPHAAFRAFRALLFAPAQDCAPPAGAAAGVPRATALLHCFSRLPNTIAAPHERPGVSAKQFSQWLDQRGESEVLASIADTLQGARASVPQQQALLTAMQTAARA